MANEINVSREVQAPADTVWRMVSDVTRMGEWSPETTSCAWLKGASGPAVGARFKGVNQNGKKKWATTCTVVTSDPGQAFVFDAGVGPLKIARWGYHIEPTDSGCRVTETWTDQRGGLIKKLGKPFSGVADRETHNRAGMETTLERLATAAESSSTA